MTYLKIIIGGVIFFTVISPAVAVVNIDYQLNNLPATANLPADGSGAVTINLTAAVPVKWNTIAICAVADAICNRTTAVKYFTQTTTYSSTAIKSWTGARSDDTIVLAGEYKLKVTVKNEADEETIAELSPYLITVGGSGSGAAINPSPVINNQTTADNPPSPGAAVSVHAGQVNLSGKNSVANWEITAGRPRRVLVGVPVIFEVGTIAGSPLGSRSYTWVFGDGASFFGPTSIHTYRFPGVYQVVVNAQATELKAVARTTVTVEAPQLSIEPIGPAAAKITNHQPIEVNLGGFRIAAGPTTLLIIPTDTIIAGRTGVIMSLPVESAINPKDNRPLTILSPTGDPVATTLVIQESSADPTASRTKNQMIANPPETATAPAVIELTAAVGADSDAGGWWRKFINWLRF